MAQPLNRFCTLPPRGEIDHLHGEFWVENPFDMLVSGHNLSAYERNQVYLNVDGESFLNVSYASQADLDSDSRSAVWADFSGDGAPDLLVGSVGGGPMRLFYNQFPTANRRVRLRLVGTRDNRSGIGTRVVASCGERQIVRDVFPANGFMGHGPTELCLGVGAAERIDRLSLRWPNGQTQQLEKLPVDCQLTIRQGESEYRAVPFRASED